MDRKTPSSSPEASSGVQQQIDQAQSQLALYARDLKHVVGELRESEARLRVVVETATDAIITADVDGVIRSWNKAAQTLFGYREDEVLGQPLTLLMPERYQYAHLKGLARLRAGGEPRVIGKPVELYGLHRDGDEFPLELSLAAWQLKGAPCYTGIIRDISERKCFEEAQQRSAERLQQILVETIQAMALAVEKRDPYTAGHQRRVAQLAVAIAETLELEAERIEGIRLGAIIHDIGKIYVPAEILNRPGKLTPVEFELIKSHPEVGYDIIKGIEFPWPVADMVRQHHERLDGSGYPLGLVGDDISMEARILAVADVVEAMSSHRPYRPGLGIAVALQEIEQNSGCSYEAVAVNACLALFREKGFSWEVGK